MNGPHPRRAPDPILFERAMVRRPIAVEVDRPEVLRPRLTGFWLAGEFHRVVRVLEVRRERGELFCRVLTDRGAFDLRRYYRTDPWSLRGTAAWEAYAELEAVEV
ncbi:MAG: hypothetical protein HY660_01240 [Armatimonadetes bacterium]|nr:hypothetical protein [Armatimonadota bacterium]